MIDEIMKMNDWMRLRLEVEAYPELQLSDIYLAIDLRLNHKKIHEIGSEGEVIETVVLRINDIESGNFNYC